MPGINFLKVSELVEFCNTNKLDPTVVVTPKKHSNMRGEFFHVVSGMLDLNGMLLEFNVEEHLVKKDKLFKREEGYKLSEIC